MYPNLQNVTLFTAICRVFGCIFFENIKNNFVVAVYDTFYNNVNNLLFLKNSIIVYFFIFDMMCCFFISSYYIYFYLVCIFVNFLITKLL